MLNLKDLKVRIKSVKSTQKITSAMKMVAAAKLRRAQENAIASRAYAEKMERMVVSLAESMKGIAGVSPLLAGTGADQTHLIVPCTADRGLCGGFNGSIVRETRAFARDLDAAGKTVRLLCIGRKGLDALNRDMAEAILGEVTGIGRKSVTFEEAAAVGDRLVTMFKEGQFDVCTLVFNRFRSAMVQIPTRQRLIPFAAPGTLDAAEGEDQIGLKAQFVFEPEEDDILKVLLPRNIETQVFQALRESSASEQGSRMTAMDSATRNAGDMIDKLTLTYNRTRQAFITKELIEIISGAEAL